MHLSLPQRFLLLFILTSSVCKSLQCLISALTQEGDGGHLLRLTCSVVLWGGRDTANKYHWHVWGVLAVCGPPWVYHSPGQRVFPRSTLFRLQGALQGHCPKWALHFMQSPGLSCSCSRELCRGTDPDGLCILCLPGQSTSGNPVLDEHTVPDAPCILITSLVLACWFPRYAVRAPSQVCRVSLGS